MPPKKKHNTPTKTTNHPKEANKKQVKKKRALNEYFKLMLNAKAKNLESFKYTPKTGVDKGKCKLYIKKMIDFGKGKGKTKTAVYKYDKYC